MTANFKCSWMPVLAAALLMGVSNVALAGENGIHVVGIATVKARPSEAELSGTVTGEGELANDASVKFLDSRKKALAVIDNLKNADLTIEPQGSEVHEALDPQAQQQMMQGQATTAPKVRVRISEKINLKLKNVDKLEPEKVLESILKLIDTCRDAGLTVGNFGPTNWYQLQQQVQNGNELDSLLQFKIPDTTDLQSQAYKEAIADARSKAERIAQLTGVKLGPVISVQDKGASDSTARNQNGNDRTIDKEATSATFSEIPITVHVDVQFEIEK